jgi:hypothetical protein
VQYGPTEGIGDKKTFLVAVAVGDSTSAYNMVVILQTCSCTLML